MNLKKQTWNFNGYQYRWSKNYVEKEDFLTEEECVNFGERWLKKQSAREALFTCSFNCKPMRETPSLDICKKVCEYGKNGFIRCRK